MRLETEGNQDRDAGGGWETSLQKEKEIENHTEVLEEVVQRSRDTAFSVGGGYLCVCLPRASLCSSVKWAEFSEGVFNAGSFYWEHFVIFINNLSHLYPPFSFFFYP